MCYFKHLSNCVGHRWYWWSSITSNHAHQHMGTQSRVKWFLLTINTLCLNKCVFSFIPWYTIPGSCDHLRAQVYNVFMWTFALGNEDAADGSTPRNCVSWDKFKGKNVNKSIADRALKTLNSKHKIHTQ